MIEFQNHRVRFAAIDAARMRQDAVDVGAEFRSVLSSMCLRSLQVIKLVLLVVLLCVLLAFGLVGVWHNPPWLSQRLTRPGGQTQTLVMSQAS